MSDGRLPSRKDFLKAMAAGTLMPPIAEAQAARGKLLIVVAHPDDEYASAAATYRLVRESGWLADQVVITNGESGYRYAELAEVYYGVPLAVPGEDRADLTEIRKNEARRAGHVLGMRHHYFLDQKDLGFDTDAATAASANWNRPYLRAFLSSLLARERYDAVFTLLPTAQTHGHHSAATLLALSAVSELPGQRPLIFGVEPRGRQEPAFTFSGAPNEPLTRTALDGPALIFDRENSFGYRDSLNYQIVVNWVVAEHKSQGLFQSDAGKHRFEEFWLFAVSGEDALDRLSRFHGLFDAFDPHILGARGRHYAAAQKGMST